MEDHEFAQLFATLSAYFGLGIAAFILVLNVAAYGVDFNSLFLTQQTVASVSAQSQTAQVASSQSAATPFPVQVDLDSVNYWSDQVPFKDLMFQQIGWATTTAVYGTPCNSAAVTVDADGYPTVSLRGTNCVYYNWLMLHIVVPAGVTPWPAGHYVLTYNGTGTISVTRGSVAANQRNVAPGRIEFDVAHPGDLFTISILDTDPNDHLRNFHVFLASDESTYQTQPFQQAFLNELAPYNILRFMDWSDVSIKTPPPSGPSSFSSGLTLVNPTTIILPSTAVATDNFYQNMVMTANISGAYPRVFVSSYDGATRTLHLATPLPAGTLNSVYIEDYVNRTWDSRANTSVDQLHSTKGVAIEYMIALANATNKDMWINVPTAADDNYVQQMATLIKNTLNPNLKVYIEYSNETWNFSYPGYDYSEAMSKVLGLTGTAVGADAWQPYRAIQIFHIFDSVFGEPDLHAQRTGNTRLVHILTGQTAWLSRDTTQMDWMMPNSAAPTYGHKAYEYADAWAVTDYFGLPSTETGTVYTLSIDQLIADQKQSIDELVAPGADTASSPNWVYKLAIEAQRRGMKLIQYEGGEGFTVPNGDQPTVDKLTQMNRDPRMQGVYDEYFNQWIRLSQEFPGTIGNIAIFGDVGQYTKYGFWGALESSFQNLNTVPRYEGILDYVNGLLGGGTSATPIVTAAATCSWNGATVASGATVSAYQSTSVPFGQTCAQQTRTCTNGVLSGTYTASACVVASATSCAFNGQTVASGATVTAYQASSVPSGQSCSQETRTCTNGTLSGSYTNTSCTVAGGKTPAPTTCSWGGSTLASGASVTAYQSTSVPFGQTCAQQTRTCTGGTLSGSYNASSCTVATAASCTFNGATVANGATVTAYQTASDSQCTPQTRTCADGTLSGSYTNASCVVSNTTAPTTTSNTPSSSDSSTPSNTTTNTTTTVTPVDTTTLPIKVVLRKVKLAVDLNPTLSCAQLFTLPSDLSDCNDYVSAETQYNWIPVDFFIPVSSTVPSTATTPASTPASVPAVTTTASVTTPGSAVVGTQYISSTLAPGSTGANVEELQRFLVAEGLLTMPAGVAFGYYGSATELAVEQYQSQQGIVQSGTPATTGFGAVGPKTLASINAAIAASSSLLQKMSAIVVSSVVTTTVNTPASASTYTPSATPLPVKSVCIAPGADDGTTGLLTQTLSVGVCSTQVITLQEILNSSGYTVATSGVGSPGQENDYYGASTAAAVARFQKKYGITGDPSGTLGPATRAKLISLYSTGTLK